MVSLVSVDLIRECIMQGCDSHEKIKEDCLHCGFYRAEAQKRKELPLVKDQDGGLRKIVRRKRNDQGNDTGTES